MMNDVEKKILHNITKYAKHLSIKLNDYICEDYIKTKLQAKDYNGRIFLSKIRDDYIYDYGQISEYYKYYYYNEQFDYIEIVSEDYDHIFNQISISNTTKIFSFDSSLKITSNK